MMRTFLVVAGLWAASMAVGCINAPGVSIFGSDGTDVEGWEGAEAVEVGQWYFQGIEGTHCANGTPAGLGLNRGETGADLVLYLSGGGGCWDSASCRYLQTAANLNVEYDADQLGDEVRPLIDAGVFDREADVNPWPDAHYVYVPYCTADLHAGRNVATYNGVGGERRIHHVGAENLEHYLEELGEVFGDVDRVWLVGISAGGYGLAWNFEQIRQTFEDAELHVLTDAAPWLPVDARRWMMWRRNWQLQIPEGCEKCADKPEYMPTYLAESHPETRFATTVFTRDSVVAAFAGVLPAQVEVSVDLFVEERMGYDNTRAFVVEGTDHEALLELNEGLESRDGQTLSEFVEAWIAGE